MERQYVRAKCGMCGHVDEAVVEGTRALSSGDDCPNCGSAQNLRVTVRAATPQEVKAAVGRPTEFCRK